MRVQKLNRDKFHAAVCIVASATVSIVLIVQFVKWLA